MDKKSHKSIFSFLLFSRSIKRSKKAVAAVTLAIGLSLGGAMSARAIDIAQILQQINNLSNQLSQGLQTFTEVRNIASLLGILQLPSPQEAKDAIAGTFGSDNVQAVSGNLVGNITSVNTSNLAHEKIWSKQGQKEQQKIIDEATGLDRINVLNSDDSVREAAAAQGSESSQEVLKTISKQLGRQAVISSDHLRLSVIQNSLTQESNLQMSAANGSNASTQETLAGKYKAEDARKQNDVVNSLGRIRNYVLE
jgi:hypothetical protein